MLKGAIKDIKAHPMWWCAALCVTGIELNRWAKWRPSFVELKQETSDL